MTLSKETLYHMASGLRVLAADMVEQACSGHPGMPLGFADVATVLYAHHLNFNPKVPEWQNRDRLILSAGHGSALLYALNHLCGYEKFDLKQLKTFRQLGSLAAGHPEHDPFAGIETTTGPLGQGLGNAVGLALAEEISYARTSRTDQTRHHTSRHRTYCIVGDGCLMEGISQESISFAGHHQLGRLIVLFDDNEITIDGRTNLATSENHLERFKACGWHVQSIDGHNYDEIHQALKAAKEEASRPSFIACKAVIGKFTKNKAGKESAHGAPLGKEDMTALRTALNWPYPPFHLPQSLYKAFSQCQGINKSSSNEGMTPPKQDGDLPKIIASDAFIHDIYSLISAWIDDRPKLATRQSSEKTLDIILKHCQSVIGGSADLSGSNGTKTSRSSPISAGFRCGNYIHYGVREHAMAAIMNGLSLYGGFIPYGGTFLVFADYLRPALRLSALMKRQVIYALTHDSIGLGEDGPTHQPIEHLATLRAIPNLRVMRPADAVETAECWMIALESTNRPTVLALSRQKLPTLRKTFVYGENLSKFGGYVIHKEKPDETSRYPNITLVATGSEVALALDVSTYFENSLCDEKVSVRVVSMPCVEDFLAQSLDDQKEVLGDVSHIFTLEAASDLGWERLATTKNHIIALDAFGDSAPAKDLYKKFKLTVDDISAHILKVIKERSSHDV